jgi:hypothetical protein
MSGSRFLDNFLKMQGEILQMEAGKKSTKAKKSKHGTADGKDPYEGDPFTRLISEKPPKKEVLEYFKERIAQLVAKDIDNA